MPLQMTSSKYRVGIDNITKRVWEDLLSRFEDASLYQTWPFGELSRRASALSHIVMEREGEPIGCCQLRIRRSRLISIRFADINWGPLISRRGGSLDRDDLAFFIRAIKREYSLKRGYFLRIWPHVTGERKVQFKSILESEGFKENREASPYRTFIIDLSPPLEELRTNLLQKWRNLLNRAEKNGLEIIEGTGDDLFGKFIGLAREMCSRKNISLGVDLEHYRKVQKRLPEEIKMRIMIGEYGHEPVAAIICSALGNKGIYLLGATGDKGLTLNGSYLLQWQMIKRLKESGMRFYDLGAFDARENPGVYHFKRGLAGKKALEEVFLNEYDGCFNLRGRLVKMAARGKSLLEKIA
jgi:lipid II:glycine glycyltransferase (peptidoglycan interpeptide bridge formation enzyme)